MKLLLLSILVFSFVVCGAQTKAVGDAPLSDAPLSLETFDFATPINVLYPAKNKSRKTSNLKALEAIQKFLKFQIEDHRTSDPITVEN